MYDSRNSLINLGKCQKKVSMGRGRKQKSQKMKNKKRQSAKKSRLKRLRESVHKSRVG